MMLVMVSVAAISKTFGLLRFLFFFQAEAGIRDLTVTGVQTCALRISLEGGAVHAARGRGELFAHRAEPFGTRLLARCAERREYDGDPPAPGAMCQTPDQPVALEHHHHLPWVAVPRADSQLLERQGLACMRELREQVEPRSGKAQLRQRLRQPMRYRMGASEQLEQQGPRACLLHRVKVGEGHMARQWTFGNQSGGSPTRRNPR